MFKHVFGGLYTVALEGALRSPRPRRMQQTRRPLARSADMHAMREASNRSETPLPSGQVSRLPSSLIAAPIKGSVNAI